MTELAILALFVALAVLWRRVDTLERALAAKSGQAANRPDAAALAEAPSVAQPPADSGSEPEPAALPIDDLEVSSQPARLLPRFDLEDLFGRLLPIWAGGVTLAVAGFFLVRWSIDAGLLTPPVRVALAGLFGLSLIAAAEAAYRWRERVADPRVAQALAGAGLATLYAAFYLAGTGYGLIGSTVAFVGLASVTAAAIALSFRFGLPSAVLGLVGGFAAPALVGSDDANVPLLTLYLALVTAGLAFTGRRQGRVWLGVAALAGGLGWGALLIVNGTGDKPDGLALGAYLVLLGGIVPALSGGTGRPYWLVRVGAAGLAAIQLAVLVQQGGFGALEWGLYLLLGAALAWFGWRDAAMREAGAVAAAVGVALLAFWPSPDPRGFALVAAGLATLFSGVPLGQIARGHDRPLDFAHVSAVALGLGLVTLGHFGAVLPDYPRPVMSAALLALGALPAAGVALTWHRAGELRHNALRGMEGAAALLGYGALAQVLPHDSLAWAAAGLAALVAWRAQRLMGVIATLAVVAALWAQVPLATWIASGALALSGDPMTSAELPTAATIALRLLPALAAITAWRMLAPASGQLRNVLSGVVAVFAVISAHVLYRHLFAAFAGGDFVTTGVVQRAGWEAILLGAAWLTRRRDWRTVALSLALVALAHFIWFALTLHNPLWTKQAVGSFPIANALVPAYAAGLGALLLVRRWLPAKPRQLHWGLDGATMLVIALFALSGLRHAFAGSWLTSVPVGQGEDLLRSLTGIVLAIGFLLWGAQRGHRTWRIGSLAVMVIAVLKVFLVDAAGLAGLARIASFMALGFSLIGIGWFYNRQLRVPRTAPD